MEALVVVGMCIRQFRGDSVWTQKLWFAVALVVRLAHKSQRSCTGRIFKEWLRSWRRQIYKPLPSQATVYCADSCTGI